MIRSALPALFPMLAALPATAQTCDDLKAQIDAKIRAGGMQNFSLAVVEQAASAPGRPVGTCGRGTMKILYRPGAPGDPAVAPAPAPRPKAKGTPDEAIITECSDGTSSLGGTCKQ